MLLPHQGVCVGISSHLSDASTQFESFLRDQGTSTDLPEMMSDMLSNMFDGKVPTKRSRSTCTETCQKQDQATCTDAVDTSFWPLSEPSQVQGLDTSTETRQQKQPLLEASVQCNILADALCGWEPDCPEAQSATGFREEDHKDQADDGFCGDAGYTSFVRASSVGDAQPARGSAWHKVREAVKSGSCQLLGEAAPSLARLPQLPSRGNILRSKRAPRDKDKPKEQLKPDDFTMVMVEHAATSSVLKEAAATDEPETTLQALSLKVAQSDPIRPTRLNAPLRRHSFCVNDVGQQEEDYRPPLPKIGERHEPSEDGETLDLQDASCFVQSPPVSPTSATGRISEALESKSVISRRRASAPVVPGLRIEVTAPTSWAPSDLDHSTQSPCSSTGSPRSPRLNYFKRPTAHQPQARDAVSTALPTVKAPPAGRRSITAMGLHCTAGLDTAHEPREPVSPSLAPPNSNAQTSPRARKSSLKISDWLKPCLQASS